MTENTVTRFSTDAKNDYEYPMSSSLFRVRVIESYGPQSLTFHMVKTDVYSGITRKRLIFTTFV